MLKKALLGLWATCVCLIFNAGGTFAAANDIVLYATDATNMRGNWARAADATAAGGQLLTSVDKGWSSTGGAQASPADTVDFTFAAPSATSYRVWLRMRGTA